MAYAEKQRRRKKGRKKLGYVAHIALYLKRVNAIPGETPQVVLVNVN